MRLGLTPWIISGTVDAQTLSRQAALAENWGYESFWLPENHFTGDGAIPEPLMLLAGAAASTTKIRLATTSFLLTLRHPLQAAEQVAVLDQLSNGRVILGVGRGYAPDMLAAFNVPAKDKREIFKTVLDTMRRAWTGEPITMEGSSEPVTISPLPFQKPYPPIWVAAFGPKALRQAGMLGMPYLASPMEPIDRLRENYQRHKEACKEEQVSYPDEIPVMRTVFVSEDKSLLSRIRHQLEEQAKQMSTSGIRKGMSLHVDDLAIIGEPGFVREKILFYRDNLGMTDLIVTRLRIGKVDPELFERSLATIAELTS